MFGSHSVNLLKKTFIEHSVDKEYADAMTNYLIHGFNPGGFFTSMLANDYFMAIQRSHPANTVESLKRLGTWIVNVMPKEAYGSYDTVSMWSRLSEDQRKSFMVEAQLAYTDEQETFLTLKEGVPRPIEIW